MRYPWANIALLVLLVLQLATGFWGLTNGAAGSFWVLWLHGAGGYAVGVLLFWKGGIIAAVLRRRRRWSLSRTVFLVLLLILLAILASGLIWTSAGPLYLAGFSLMTIHAALALVLTALLAWHTVAERFIFRLPQARDRRAFLRLLGLSLAGAAIWSAGRSAKAWLQLPAAVRRFTGSYETGSLSGNFPVVAWLFDDPAPVDPLGWQLSVEGLVARPLSLSYPQVLNLSQDTLQATLDCTGGWYSLQAWQGLSLARLLDMAGASPSAQTVTVEAITGYYRRFTLALARNFLLATHVAGQPLPHGHGYPIRLVAPGQRGFNWVKWVARVRVDDTSYLWQPPLPLQ
jgi:DMSO/TMAO reductase YedYZ molybdopterin-dependent catalytic subunit